MKTGYVIEYSVKKGFFEELGDQKKSVLFTGNFSVPTQLQTVIYSLVSPLDYR